MIDLKTIYKKLDIKIVIGIALLLALYAIIIHWKLFATIYQNHQMSEELKGVYQDLSTTEQEYKLVKKEKDVFYWQQNHEDIGYRDLNIQLKEFITKVLDDEIDYAQLGGHYYLEQTHPNTYEYTVQGVEITIERYVPGKSYQMNNLNGAPEGDYTAYPDNRVNLIRSLPEGEQEVSTLLFGDYETQKPGTEQVTVPVEINRVESFNVVTSTEPDDQGKISTTFFDPISNQIVIAKYDQVDLDMDNKDLTSNFKYMYTKDIIISVLATH